MATVTSHRSFLLSPIIRQRMPPWVPRFNSEAPGFSAPRPSLLRALDGS